MRIFRLLLLCCLAVVALLPAGCGDAPTPLRILAGSEARTLEPLLAEFTRETGIQVEMSYKGSVDIMLELARGRDADADAVWPAHSIWLTLGDEKGVIKESESIMRSPIVFALRKSKVTQLGWQGRDVTITDMLTAIRAGQLRFAMTSATQSNSGAMAYLGMLNAASGKTDVITRDDIDAEATRQTMRTLLGAVNRGSGSSGWLKDLLLADYGSFDGMVNYEAVMIEANQELVRRGDEPLCAIYPRDAMTIADHPLALIDRSGTEGFDKKRDSFLKLRDWLMSDRVQGNIRDLGRRTGAVGIAMPGANAQVFNPDWCINTSKIISPIRLPDEDTIRYALQAYQEGMRRPSHTVMLLDVSGSMSGEGITQLKSALDRLFDPEESRRFMIQPGGSDRITLIPFSGILQPAFVLEGNDEAQLQKAKEFVDALQTGGGTQFYLAVDAARKILATAEAEGALPAIVLMTDGKSEDCNDYGDCPGAQLRGQLGQLAPGRNIPVFSITFGDADPAQLDRLAKLTAGRVFEGTKDLAKAFREARGYN